MTQNRSPKDASWHYRDGFKNQYQRTYRWHVRLKDMEAGQFSSVRMDHSLLNDYLLTFFGNCFAMRDWVKDEPQWPAIEARLQSHPVLMVCRDIVTVSKHKRSSQPSMDAEFSFGTGMSPGKPNRVVVIISPGKFLAKFEKIIEREALATGQTVDWKSIHAQLQHLGFPVSPSAPTILDALTLAEQCIDTWEYLLVSENLLTQEELKQLQETAFNHQGF